MVNGLRRAFGEEDLFCEFDEWTDCFRKQFRAASFWSEPGSRSGRIFSAVGKESPNSVWQQAPAVMKIAGGGATRRKVQQKINRPVRYISMLRVTNLEFELSHGVRVKRRGKSPPVLVVTLGRMANPLWSKTK